MHPYILDILPHLPRKRVRLDTTAQFTEKAWVEVDTDTALPKYIFMGNGELLISSGGKIKSGLWEYLPMADTIILSQADKKRILNVSFFDNAIILLRHEGTRDKHLVLANEMLIPNLDVEGYLMSLVPTPSPLPSKTMLITNMVLKWNLSNGKILEISLQYGQKHPQPGDAVTIGGLPADDGTYKSADSGRYFEIENGKIYRMYYKKLIRTQNGIELSLEQAAENSISKGDRVYLDDQPAPDGTHKLGHNHSFRIENGGVKRVLLF